MNGVDVNGNWILLSYLLSSLSLCLIPPQPKGPMPKNESDVASDFYGFLSNFYNIFETMKHKDLFLFGESYAGMSCLTTTRMGVFLFRWMPHMLSSLSLLHHYLVGMYVPSIARTIYLENKQLPQKDEMPLKGIALGNGWIDASVQGPAVIDYAWWHGLIDFPTKQTLHQEFEQCFKQRVVKDTRLHHFTTPDECGIMEAVQVAAGMGVTSKLSGPNIYDVTTWDRCVLYHCV